MELLTIENAIETYPHFVSMLGTTPKGMEICIIISLFAFLLIMFVSGAAVYWMLLKDTRRGVVLAAVLTIIGLALSFIPYNYLNSLEKRGEEQQRDIITSALEKPEYQEKVESKFNDLGTSIDDVCSIENNYPSLLCFKEQKGNVTWVGDKKNEPVTWKGDGVSYSLSIIPEYDKDSDQITVSLEWEATSK